MKRLTSLALLMISAAVALAADNADALLARARELAGAGKYAEALPLFTRAVELAPDNHRAHVGRAAMLNRLDRYAEGLAAIDRAVALVPDQPMLRYNRGLSLWETGRFVEAVAEFDRATAGRPELPMPYADRALAKLCLGDLPGAFADCEKALAADKDYIWARYYRAMAHYVAGDFAKAADDFAAVAKQEAGFTAAHLWNHVAARRAGRSLVTDPPPTTETAWPGPLLAHLRGEISAAALLDMARAQRVPDDERRLAAAHTAIGLANLFAGRKADARAAFRAALAIPAPHHFEQIVARAELARLE
jgi:tetratricopeptide (TPR) repeat protein